ncbi:MAG TPA: hypothetical protein VJ698_14070 [Noviherbaspirillum sp.]|uniref:hypothetical protein n=1 Tax=Noviherbaspirillum sp. TaxID=1926288 RepID=UPI002B459F80|nr:hypothetical protein [Noviherbaspirillum sp.]HJV86595.1 hypothetical protein [Noviherbaspirillum sp.]
MTVKEGIRRKTIAFTRSVLEARSELEQMLGGAFQTAIAHVRRIPEWKKLDACTDNGLQALDDELTKYRNSIPLLKRNRTVEDMLNSLIGARDSDAVCWLMPLIGKRRFRQYVMVDVTRRSDSLAVIEREIAEAATGTGQAGYVALHGRERRTLLRTLVALTQHGVIDAYTGCSRPERA